MNQPLGWRWKDPVSLDAKTGRFSMPDRIRQLHGFDERGGFYFVGMEDDGYLVIHTEAQHEAWVRALQQTLGQGLPVEALSRAHRHALRRLTMRYQRVICDPQGRIVLPKELRAQAGLDQESKLVILIQEDRTEVWGEQAHAAYDAATDLGDMADLVDRLREEERARALATVGAQTDALLSGAEPGIDES